MNISKHAEKRLKERCGTGRKTSRRMVRKVFKEGIRHSQTKGRLNKWVTKLYFKNQKANNIRLYGDKAYIFCGETLVTVVQIPVGLMKDFRKMVKEDAVAAGKKGNGYGKTGAGRHGDKRDFQRGAVL